MDFENGQLLKQQSQILPTESEESKKGSLEHTINSMNTFIKLEKPWYIRVLHFFAAPFSYESGFYFKGKKSYHMKSSGFCTILGLIFLLSSTIVLFVPVFSGRVIYTDLESLPFNTPADLPPANSVPSSITQFFGG